MKFPLIVRSSATVEDAKKASFAGMFTSYPNAGSIDDIIERIERIYSFLYAGLLIDLSLRRGLNPRLPVYKTGTLPLSY